MAIQGEISKEAKARRDHRAWLEDYELWRAEHRKALMMLTQVQAAILEREEALERQAAEVRSHELELHDYELVGGDVGTPDPEEAIPAHAEFAVKHNREREVYERTKRQHVNIVAEVEKLFQICQLRK